MHIVIADSLPASAADALRAAGWSVDAKAGRTPDELARDLSNADALIVRSATQVTAQLIEAAPKLRVIARAGTGVDNVDVPAATARGILVMNAAGASSVSVAELAVGLMLTLARPIPAADASMKRGEWEKKKFMGVELRGKLLGVIGFGRIGREVAARARAFGMEIVAYDPFIAARAAEAAGIPLVELDDLLARADFISLHMPSLPETHHVMNAERLARCKKGVRIVNTARGELVDEAARKALVVWRKLSGDAERDNLALDAWFTKQGYSSKDSEFGLIYVNGSNNLENLKIADESWKVRLIEEDFHRLMFAEDTL